MLPFMSKREVNLVITDNYIRFVEISLRRYQVIRAGEYKLRKEVVEGGKITNIKLLSRVLSTLFKRYKIKANKVNIMIPDAILVLRRFSIPHYIKDEDIKSYLQLEFEQSVHLPFKNPIIDILNYQVVSEEIRHIIMYATSKDEMSKYIKMLQRNNKTVTSAQLSPIITRKLHLHSKNLLEDEIQYSLYIQLNYESINMTVFDNEIPVLSITDIYDVETESDEENFTNLYEKIDRIAHYFKYKFTNGKHSILRGYIITQSLELSKIADRIIDTSSLNIEKIEIKNFEIHTHVDDIYKYYQCLGMSIK